MEENRLPKMCFLRQLEITRIENKYNWASQVKNLLEFANCQRSWRDINVAFLKANKNDLIDTFKQKVNQNDLRQLNDSSFLTFYRALDLSDQPQQYLHIRMPLQFTRTIAQLRLSNEFCIRFTFQGLTYKIDPKQLCTICNKRELETLRHLLFECPIYTAMRPQNITNLLNPEHLANTLNNITPSTAKTISNHIWNILKLRAFVINE
uniref:Uncharacterized protein LOC114336426 isoform X1 n=1 Tax=Diabrotica virgifera virgifera TaxID=50390 RepID=A0A6P7G156_DIAVI